MVRKLVLGAAVALTFGTAVAQQQSWYPAPVPPPPPAERTQQQQQQQPVPGYPAPDAPATPPATTKHQPSSKNTNNATTPSSSTSTPVPLIDRVEDATRPLVTTGNGNKLMPLTQGRTWKIFTRGVEGGAGGRQFWLTREKMSPVKLRTDKWNEGEMIVALPANSITADGTYRLELHQDGSLLAARTVKLVATLPDDFDGDGVGRDRDCDDLDARIHPGASEVCDSLGVDEDCDATTVAGTRAYVDADGDGFGSGDAVIVCDKAQIGHGFALVAGDCNDRDAKLKPGAGCR